MSKSFLLSFHHAHTRLDHALAERLPEYSRTQIQNWIRKGAVCCSDGSACKVNLKIKGGETFSITIPDTKPLIGQAEAIPLTILYEDEALIVVNKPVGLVVHPGAGHSEHTLLNALLYHAPTLSVLARAGIVHRLDKNTSGLMVVAKSQQSFQSLSHQLRERTVLREYQAIAQGHFHIPHGVIETNIARHKTKRQQMTVTESGKKAITHYQVLERYRDYSLLNLRLKTGRTHQIRVHMAYIHHPLLGDPVYGKALHFSKKTTLALADHLRSFSHQALCAYRLGLYHPLTNDWMQWQIELPDTMKHLIEDLRNDIQVI